MTADALGDALRNLKKCTAPSASPATSTPVLTAMARMFASKVHVKLSFVASPLSVASPFVAAPLASPFVASPLASPLESPGSLRRVIVLDRPAVP